MFKTVSVELGAKPIRNLFEDNSELTEKKETLNKSALKIDLYAVFVPI